MSTLSNIINFNHSLTKETTMSTISTNIKNLQIYAAGGAATNVAARFNKTRDQVSPGFAKITSRFIDTSRSNIDPSIPDSDVYLFEGMDGSGKLRSSNYATIAERSKEILHRFKPQDTNIVIHSTSGGSGSTIGPVLVSELLARGENVVVLLIGSTSSRIETENTLKTLQSYEVIAQKRNKPVVAYYRENAQGMSRGEVDQQVYYTLLMLSVLFSGQNREMDSADLTNFLNYHNVTNYGPSLVGLDLFSKDITLKTNEVLMSVATLIDENTSSDFSGLAEYQTTGHMPEALKDNNRLELPLHIATIAGYFNSTVKRLQDRIGAYDDHRRASVVKPIVNNASANATDDGLIL